MSFVLRAGFEGSGSPRWLMRTLQRHGLDRTHGFRLELELLREASGPHGTLHAIAEGRADVVDSDWLALAAARAAGLPVTAVLPYGRILGTAMLRRGLAGEGLPALRGRRLGVLSLRDKNWAILRVACAQTCAFDLEKTVDVATFATRAELDAALDCGAVDAALVHWHRVPELEAAGHRVLAEIPDLVDQLEGGGLPTTFFVVHEALANERPQRVAAFIAAARAGIGLLQGEIEPWGELAQEGDSGLPCTAPLAALRRRWSRRIAQAAPWGPETGGALSALRQCLQAGAGAMPAGVFAARFLP